MITIENIISANILQVWENYINPEKVKEWNTASPDWHCPKAENNLKVWEKFCYTMSAKDWSFSFDFSGTYTEIISEKILKYTLDDGRKVEVIFEKIDENISKIITNFEPENMNEIDFQKSGWQAILDNFKKFCEK